MTEGKDENIGREAPAEAEPKIRAKRPGNARAIPDLVKIGTRVSFILSIAFFAGYVAGSAYAPGIADGVLFALLRLTRYFGISLSLLSVAALGFAIRRFASAPKLRGIFRVCLYFFLMLLGAILAMFTLLIVTLSQGN